jgi:malonyl-CoA O-methyltransferase
MTTRRDLDDTAVRRVARRLATAAEPPWLHGEVARRMAERLPMILRRPDTVVEWSGHLGASDALLAAAYPKARRALVEPMPELHARSATAVRGPWWSMRRLRTAQPAIWSEADVPAGHAQLVWSNMLLHAMADPPALLALWKRALAGDGFLMFSTLGPATLHELGALYGELGWPAPLAPFVDMHDLGDMLVEAGFADPVMDQEQLVLSWRDGDALLQELRGLGGNVHRARLPGLRTPRWKRRLLEALGSRRDAQGRISMSFEIVYGHAFNAPPRAPVKARTEVGLDDFRRMTRRAGQPRSGPI